MKSNAIIASHLLKGAITGGVVNAVINGIINWFQVKGHDSIYVSVDSITNTEHTILGGGVMLATSLAAILTVIAYATFKVSNKPSFFPKGLIITLKNTFFAFGLMVTISIVFQKAFGTITVGPFTSVIITAVIAGFVAALVDYQTKKELLN